MLYPKIGDTVSQVIERLGPPYRDLRNEPDALVDWWHPNNNPVNAYTLYFEVTRGPLLLRTYGVYVVGIEDGRVQYVAAWSR